MTKLHNKNILLAVTGGIAAYKSVYLVRQLKQRGANVRVMMTAAAKEFVTPLTFQAVSSEPVHDNLLDTDAEAAMGHIQLARWADVIVVAPATANTIANIASGQAQDLVTTVCLASAAPLAVAPAMNQQMWAQVSTQDNIEKLQHRGVAILGPAAGEQACGDVGEGRMLEPEEILASIEQIFSTDLLSGVRVVITAGPTREAIDPVRYISNHSSGKMGFALAQAAQEAGASVTLVSGPCELEASDRISRIDVTTAEEMLKAVESQLGQMDIFISVAAVADYRVAEIAEQKIKKTADALSLKLVKNPDILATIASNTNRPFCVGFAAETEQLEEFAKKKLTEKNLDMIIANRVDQDNVGFNSDYNSVTAIWQDGQQEFEIATKTRLARELIQFIASRFKK